MPPLHVIEGNLGMDGYLKAELHLLESLQGVEKIKGLSSLFTRMMDKVPSLLFNVLGLQAYELVIVFGPKGTLELDIDKDTQALWETLNDTQKELINEALALLSPIRALIEIECAKLNEAGLDINTELQKAQNQSLPTPQTIDISSTTIQEALAMGKPFSIFKHFKVITEDERGDADSMLGLALKPGRQLMPGIEVAYNPADRTFAFNAFMKGWINTDNESWEIYPAPILFPGEHPRYLFPEVLTLPPFPQNGDKCTVTIPCALGIIQGEVTFEIEVKVIDGQESFIISIDAVEAIAQ